MSGWGQALCIARGAIHRFDNNGSRDAKALCVITPAAIGPQFFRECAEVINSALGGPPDWAKMAEIMLRHGLTPGLQRELSWICQCSEVCERSLTF